MQKYTTGGGPPPQESKLDQTEEKILSMIGPQFTAMENNFDSDAPIHNEDVSKIIKIYKQKMILTVSGKFFLISKMDVTK